MADTKTSCFNLSFPTRLTPSINGNTDMDGFVVIVSNVVINICIPILFIFSHEGIETSIFMLFSQAYPTLLATYFVIGKKELNVVDSRIAIFIISSPVCIYLVYSVVRGFIGQPNNFFKRITTSKRTIKTLSLLLLTLWFSLTFIVSFSSTAFVDSDRCKTGKFLAWLKLLFASLGPLLLFWMQLPLVIVYPRYIWLHRREIREESKRVKEKTPSLFYRLITFYQPIRDVLFKEHPWLLFGCLFSSYFIWVTTLVRISIPVLYFTPLTFGQILTLLAMVPPLNSILELSYERRSDLRTYLRGAPRSLWLHIVFFWTGSRPILRESDRLQEILLSSKVDDAEYSVTLPAVDQIYHPTPNTHADDASSAQL